MNFVKFLRTPLLQNTSGQQLLKRQGFQEAPLRTFANFVRRKVKIMAFKTLPKIPEVMLDKPTHLSKATALIS